MVRKKKEHAIETRQHILDTALRIFAQRGVSTTTLEEIARAAGVTRGAIYWHFKNKSDLFSEIWALSKSSISIVEQEYCVKFPDDPLSVLKGVLVYALESTVEEESRRLMLEIIYHKCEFVGEMAIVQYTQRDLCMQSYDRIQQVLIACMDARLLPMDLLIHRAAVLIRSYISGLIENWLFAPQSFDLKEEARAYVDILLEMLLCCPTIRASSSAVNKSVNM
ncbi:multidrug efflux transporter transcriptional repressor AcrR [Citrobacter werkmanii]|uniref:multidrug efflux transporter transcriptional repressor AcrR n=1 Tax=Citrobacter werkmanii TaxID=67827 RepID=UPI003463EC7A